MRRTPQAGPSTTTGDVIGVDYGTLSGRAVVVRVSDGEELGSAVLRVPPRRPRPVAPAELAGPTSASGPTGRCRCPPTTSRCCAPPCPPPSRPRGRRPGRRSSASPPTSPPARWCRPSPTARRCASCPSFARPSRTPTSSSGSTTPPSRRPTGSTSWPRERGEAWLPRYGGLISSEWEFAKGLQLLEEAPEVYAAMEHWVEAADWIVWQLCGTYVRNACTAGYKGIYQDGAYPSPRLPRRAQPGLRATSSSDKLDHADRPARRRRRPADRARPPPGPGCPRASPSPSATSTPTSPPRPPTRSSPARWSRSWAPRPAT